jgi:anti-sigma B factor antagonist
VKGRPPAAPGGCDVVATTLAGTPGVAVRGELDIATVAEVTSGLEEAIRDSDGLFVIDLCELAFLASSGVGALLRALALLGRHERHLALVCPPGDIRRVLATAGVDDMFTLFDSREDARARLSPRW